jgi:hypothetical protein
MSSQFATDICCAVDDTPLTLESEARHSKPTFLNWVSKERYSLPTGDSPPIQFAIQLGPVGSSTPVCRQNLI